MSRKARASRKEICIGDRADGSLVRLPVIQYEGSDGPSLFIGAGIHGDELTGPASLWKLHEYLKRRVLRGSVTIMPAMNPEGLNYDIRGMPEAGVDLNRLYPGKVDGYLPERITAKIWEVASRHDAIVDLHTNGWAVPFVLVDPVEGELRRRTFELAEATGITVLEELEAEDYALENLGASLGGAAIKKGIPSITIELGGSKGIDWGTVDAGYIALTNILAHMGMIDDRPKPVRSCFVLRQKGYRRRDVWSDKGGLMEYLVEPGTRARKGFGLARVRDVWGDIVEDVRMPQDGYVVALNPWHVASTGTYIGTIAVKSGT